MADVEDCTSATAAGKPQPVQVYGSRRGRGVTDANREACVGLQPANWDFLFYLLEFNSDFCRTYERTGRVWGFGLNFLMQTAPS